MRQTVSSANYLQPSHQQQTVSHVHNPSPLQPIQYSGSLSPMSGMENYLPSSLMGTCDVKPGPLSDPWCIPSTTPFNTAAIGDVQRNTVVPYFSDGMLAAARDMGASNEATFWRVSPRDDVVEGFKGISPFGPIGPFQYFRG